MHTPQTKHTSCRLLTPAYRRLKLWLEIRSAFYLTQFEGTHAVARLCPSAPALSRVTRAADGAEVALERGWL